MKQANSDRRVFALKRVTASSVEGEAQESELWHLYCAMGLPRQHAWQQSLLARCYDFHGAASILCAISNVLGKSVYSEMITEARPQGLNASSLRDDFLSVCDRATTGVIQGWPVQPGTLSKIAGESVVQSTLQARSFEDCVPFLDVVVSTELRQEIASSLHT